MRQAPKLQEPENEALDSARAPGRASFAIAYGTIGDAGAALANETPGLIARGGTLSPRLALIEPGQPAIRLNSHGWVDLQPQTIAALGTNDDKLAFCREQLFARCGLFSRPIRAFVASYLAFVADHVETNRPELEDIIAQAGLPVELSFPAWSDWVFSAYLPLPNAHVRCPSAGGGEADFFRFDVAFWTGTELVGVLLNGLTMRLRSQQQRLDRLQAEHANLHVVHVASSLSPGAAMLASVALRDRLGRFWAGQPLPFGLYRAGALLPHDGKRA